MNTMSCHLVEPMSFESSRNLYQIVLHGLGDFAMAYLDDIIIFSALEEHKKNIQNIFEYLRQHNLKEKIFKMKVYAERKTVSGFHN